MPAAAASAASVRSPYVKMASVVGLEAIKQVLVSARTGGKVPHALLFTSRRGGGALPLALTFGAYVNCEQPVNGDACGQCFSCQQIERLTHPDVHFIYPTTATDAVKAKDANSEAFLPHWRSFLAENPYASLADWAAYLGAENRQLTIARDEARNMLKALRLKGYGPGYKIMLIWLPELMHPAAANAILKVLEEPPAKTLFLLVSEQPERLLTTILSRTQPVRVPPFTQEEVKANLTERFGIPADRAAAVAAIAEGNLNEALALAQQVEAGSVQRFRDWMRLCFRADYAEILSWSEQFASWPKEEQKSLLTYGLGMFRQALAWKYGGDELVRLEADSRGFIQNFAGVITEQNVLALTDSLTQAHFHLERNANPKLTFLHVSVQVAQIFAQGK